jgi:hypothetical protein
VVIKAKINKYMETLNEIIKDMIETERIYNARINYYKEGPKKRDYDMADIYRERISELKTWRKRLEIIKR